MHRLPPLQLMERWVELYQDHQAMIDAPGERLSQLDELAELIAGSGLYDQKLPGVLKKKASHAYRWALELSPMLGKSISRRMSDQHLQVVTSRST